MSNDKFEIMANLCQVKNKLINFCFDPVYFRIEYNFLERLWAYLTIQNLFTKLSKVTNYFTWFKLFKFMEFLKILFFKGELVSCAQPGPLPPVLGKFIHKKSKNKNKSSSHWYYLLYPFKVSWEPFAVENIEM